MKQKILFTLIALIPGTLSSFGQSRKMIYNDVLNTDGYYYFPEAIFADSVDGIHLKNVQDSLFHDQTTISFYWASFFNDGSYHLNISPKQIYLTSGHDNPNPNYVFWATDIDSLRYNIIRAYIDQDTPTGFRSIYDPLVFFDTVYNSSYPRPSEDIQYIQDSMKVHAEFEMELQLNRYSEFLNEILSESGETLQLPSKAYRDSLKPQCISKCMLRITIPPETLLPLLPPKEED